MVWVCSYSSLKRGLSCDAASVLMLTTRLRQWTFLAQSLHWNSWFASVLWQLHLLLLAHSCNSGCWSCCVCRCLSTSAVFYWRPERYITAVLQGSALSQTPSTLLFWTGQSWFPNCNSHGEAEAHCKLPHLVPRVLHDMCGSLHNYKINCWLRD